MRIVAIDAPGLQHALDVAVVAGPPDVIHDFVAAIIDQGLAYLGREGVEHFIPGRALPLAFTTRADAFQRKEDAFRVIELIDRRRAFSAVAPARCRMLRVAFELANLARF